MVHDYSRAKGHDERPGIEIAAYLYTCHKCDAALYTREYSEGFGCPNKDGGGSFMRKLRPPIAVTSIIPAERDSWYRGFDDRWVRLRRKKES
jgi:hypothetical protein